MLRRLVCPSNGRTNHARGLEHGTVDVIECINVVVVSRATHCFGLHLVNVDDAANTRHRSICNVLMVHPGQVVGSNRLTGMSRKEVDGCGGRRCSCTTTCRSLRI